MWVAMANSPYLPLYAEGAVHNEFASYWGEVVNQADVALLQWPLGLSLDPSLARRDLDFWASRTNFSYMFTGDAAYAVAYLALGLRSAADSQLAVAFSHIHTAGFMVWSELAAQGGCLHFLTGAGGFLQTMLFGYGSLRVPRPGVWRVLPTGPVLPPMGVTSVVLRGIHLQGAVANMAYNETHVCVSLQAAQKTGVSVLVLVPGGGGTSQRIGFSDVCLRLPVPGGFEVRAQAPSSSQAA